MDGGRSTGPDEAEALSLRTLRKRGHLKIFLGYAPGVGKTYMMLAEAQRRRARGEDVVVGFVETHGRRETAELAEGLEEVPRKEVDYRGRTFTELDTAALVARAPHLALIDELAHTNVPGTTHIKRWQSVEEVLKAGIDVLSTVNIQHLESLNDTVHEITGVRVQETVPDFVLDRADEIVLVDLTTDALLNRLKRGVVYDLDTVPGALANFFRPANLVALRELALRKAAEEVDEALERYVQAHDHDHPWATEDRVVVCLRPGEVAPKLVRRGHRLARRFKGVFWVVHVRTGQHSGGHRRELEKLFALTRELGGHAVELSGDDAAQEILKFATEKRATFIVLGQSKRSRANEVLRGSSLVARIMRGSDHIDILVVADPSKAAPGS
jgi:two-component system, OmpR family, sensor histidine kinase KdpD